MRLKEIEERLSQIKAEIETDGADIDALTRETDELMEERTKLMEAVQKRAATIEKIAAGVAGKEVEKMENTVEKRTFALDSEEYRGAFLKNLIGKELDTEERAALTMNNTVAHTAMQSGIMKKVKEFSPVIEQVTLVSVPGYVKFAVEGVTNEASDHTENKTITPDSDTIVEVELNAKEIVKMVQISESVSQMSIDGLEAFLIENIARAIAAKIENKVITAMVAGADSVGTAINAEGIYGLFAALKAGYNGRVYCSRNTLFTKLLGLQDKSKNDLVVNSDKTYYLLGTEVVCTPSIDDNTILLADPKKFVANLAENINVRKAYDIDTNSYKFLGVALYDGKVAIAEAFKKIVVAG